MSIALMLDHTAEQKDPNAWITAGLCRERQPGLMRNREAALSSRLSFNTFAKLKDLEVNGQILLRVGTDCVHKLL